MWKKSDLELTERIEEATHAEKKQKANLEQKSQEITVRMIACVCC